MDRLRGWFPEREFFMRSEGQVRFIKITSRAQIVAASIAALATLGYVGSVGGMAVNQYLQRADRIALLEREAHVEDSESRLAAYRDDIDEVANDLEVRQDFIEQMVDGLPADLKAEAASTVSDSTSEAGETVAKVSAALPEAAKLAAIEARQLAFVEGLTRVADARAARAEQAIRQLGLDPRRMVAADTAQGGPLELLGMQEGDTLDPRFERLGLSLARMSALERGLKGIPQVAPAKVEMVSSSYGYRRDPFTGAAAMHRGLDFRGPMGAPIYAAAQGTVSFVGVKSGYGKVVEISHGNGLMTRYAHMSRFGAKVGQKVAAGAPIGAIGSTGRSTGPHLHFEVRVNDQAVDPRPFLEKAPDVLEETRRARRGARKDAA